jgi:hypothetical protein
VHGDTLAESRGNASTSIPEVNPRPAKAAVRPQIEPSRSVEAQTLNCMGLARMARRKTRESLARDRAMLRSALGDYEAGAMAHLDQSEQASVVESLRQRIAELDAMIEEAGDR